MKPATSSWSIDSRTSISVMCLAAWTRVDGLSAPQIAERLFLGLSTIKTHLHHLYEKLGVGDRDRAAAVVEGMQRGLKR
jgi:ATP/maltotriose-dependent transcriptional regulator MalT